MAEMPKTVRLIDKNGDLRFPVGHLGTEYIRSDLVSDAVKALEEARERVEHWADVASRADRTRYDTSDDLAKIDAALTRIKETT